MLKKFKISSDLVKEANESLKSLDGYPSEDGKELLKSLESTSIEEGESLKNFESSLYENMIEKITSSLSKIEKKIDLDNLHLKKLDQLDKLNELDVLKKEVMQMQIENNRITVKANEQEITNTNNNNNLPDISEILNRIDEVDTKIKKVEKGVLKNELTNAYYQKRFTNIENTMDRFESLEKEIKIEYEEDDNALKKNKYLKIFLLLLLIFLMMIVGDRLGFIDLYIDEIIKSFF